jgi:hypothetical protein
MAKIEATCPHCGAENRHNAAAAGLHVTCPECGGRFQLDYLRPQRGCFSSCLPILLVAILAGVVASGVAF